MKMETKTKMKTLTTRPVDASLAAQSVGRPKVWKARRRRRDPMAALGVRRLARVCRLLSLDLLPLLGLNETFGECELLIVGLLPASLVSGRK